MSTLPAVHLSRSPRDDLLRACSFSTSLPTRYNVLRAAVLLIEHPCRLQQLEGVPATFSRKWACMAVFKAQVGMWVCMWQATSASYIITYKGGQVLGSVGTDVITMTQSPLSLYNQTFGLTNDSTLDFSRASCDGIFVSLGSPHISCALCRTARALHAAAASHTLRQFSVSGTAERPRRRSAVLGVLSVWVQVRSVGTNAPAAQSAACLSKCARRMLPCKCTR